LAALTGIGLFGVRSCPPVFGYLSPRIAVRGIHGVIFTRISSQTGGNLNFKSILAYVTRPTLRITAVLRA